MFWCGLVGKVLENVQDDVSGGVVPGSVLFPTVPEARFQHFQALLCMCAGDSFPVNDFVDEVLFELGEARR